MCNSSVIQLKYFFSERNPVNTQILAVAVGIALTAAVLTPTLSSNSNNALAQVSAESRVLQAILGLTDQVKEQTTESKGKFDNIILDLNVKKKFYEFTPEEVESGFIFTLLLLECGEVPPDACAFNVESIQIDGTDEFGFGATVSSVIVDGVFTDFLDKGITTPTNFMVDSGIGKLGASDFVSVELDRPINGTIEWNGEKPQGILLFTDVLEIPAIFSVGAQGTGTSSEECAPGADRETLKQCIEDRIEAIRSSG